MPRIRTIKPEFFTSLDVAKMTPWARLLFIGLWTHSDDEGRNLNEPLLIKAALFPLEQHLTHEHVAELMWELANHGVIDLYHDEAGRSFYQVRGWKDHQKIDRAKPSKYPSPTDRGCVVDSSSMDRGRVVLERKGKDQTHALVRDALDAYVMSVCLAQKNTNSRFRDAVYDKAAEERGPVLKAYIDTHPDATADDLRELLGLDRLEPAPTKARTAHPDDCEACGGEGIVEVSPNTFAPCDLVGNVLKLRPA